MVNTIWKENFLIMCSKLCLNARDSGHFAQLLLICRNYSLQTLCGAPHNVCNEEGKFLGLPLNRALRDDTGEIYDIIAGNFLITGLGEESFSDLPPDLLEKYKEQFLAPESFAQIGGKILAVKQPVPSPEDKERTQKPPHKSGPEL